MLLFITLAAIWVVMAEEMARCVRIVARDARAIGLWPALTWGGTRIPYMIWVAVVLAGTTAGLAAMIFRQAHP